MSVAELQKIIRGLSPEDRRVLAVIAARMARRRKPAQSRPVNAKGMPSGLGCLRKGGRVEIYTPAQLAEFERNNEAPLKKIRLG